MIEPFPNWRSICMTAVSRARFLPFSEGFGRVIVVLAMVKSSSGGSAAFPPPEPDYVNSTCFLIPQAANSDLSIQYPPEVAQG
jgi:hypothetical protein